MNKYDVLVIGDYCLDLVFTGLTGYPELGKEIYAQGLEIVPGGAYNVTAAMHRLGLRVGWAADFGEDGASRLVLAHALADGLDGSFFAHHSRSLRRITVAASYPDDRAFITYEDPGPALPAAIKALGAATAHAVFVAGIYHGPHLSEGLAAVRAHRAKLVMDGNSGCEVTLEDPDVRRAVASSDAFLPNAREARRLTGEQNTEAALRALGKLCPLVVVKDGPNGAFGYAEGRIVHEPPIPVTSVDTTGAGDCFDAGFLKAWLNGRSLRDCLRWGNIVGGLSTTRPGGTGRHVTEADVAAWLEA